MHTQRVLFFFFACAIVIVKLTILLRKLKWHRYLILSYTVHIQPKTIFTRILPIQPSTHVRSVSPKLSISRYICSVFQFHCQKWKVITKGKMVKFSTETHFVRTTMRGRYGTGMEEGPKKPEPTPGMW